MKMLTFVVLTILCGVLSGFLWNWAYDNYKIQDWFLMGVQILAGLFTAGLTLQGIFWTVTSWIVSNHYKRQMDRTFHRR